MATHSLYDQKTDLVAIGIKIGGKDVSDKVQVHGFSVYKSLFKISTAKVEIQDGNISEAKFETIENEKYEHGEEVEISSGYHNDKKIIYKGIIIKHSVKISSNKSSRIVLELADKAIKLTGQRKFKYFKDTTDSALMNQIITTAKEVDSTDIVHERIIQHNTSDWDFIITRAQANNMVVAIDEGVVKVKKPKTGNPSVKLVYGENIIDVDLSIDGRSQVEELETTAWDPSKQEIVRTKGKEPDSIDGLGSFKGKDVASSLSYEKTELHSTGNMDKKELQAWADSMILLSRLSRVRGVIKTQGVVVNPIDTVTIESLGKYYDGEAFVSGVFHEQKEGNWTTEIEIGVSPDLFVQQKNDVSLPSADGLFPGVHGLFIGKVKQIDGDPKGEFRVRVTLPMVEGPDGDGVWARTSNIMASDNFGSWFYPEVDDEVVCGALGGDMRFPIILGHLYSSKRPYAENIFNHDRRNNDKGWFTRTEMLFHFNEDDKIIRIETPGGQKFKLDDKDKSITLEDQHKNKMVMNSEGFKFTGMKKFVVDVTGEVSLTSKTSNVGMEAKIGNFDAKGLNSTVKGSIAAKLDGSASATVNSSGMTTVKGSVVMIN